ncbi:MAG: exopolysaccharide biosynthesis protein [Hyphomonadaceae bacterium]|nr:exopolysaccharide biosynthesis protein [Hyphomonadaceae bacterium]
MNASPEPPKSPGRAASALLDDLAASFPGDTISVGELLDQLDARANGVVLLVLALPMCIPNVPGISTIFGVLMLAPALQLVLGQRRMWVPKRVRDWRVDCNTLRRTFAAATPTLRRVEYLIKPRLSELTRFPATIYVGLQTLLMALVLILPIPFGNWPPGITVALTALALLQRDGLLMLLTSLAAAASTYVAARVGVAVFNGVLHWLQGLFG